GHCPSESRSELPSPLLCELFDRRLDAGGLHPAEHGHQRKTDDDGSGPGEERSVTGGDGSDDVLCGGHGHDDRDVHSGPERDPRGGLRGESARAGEEVRGQDEHDHGDADTADVRIDPEQIAQETADESADQQTARKQGNAQDDHARASLSKSCLRLDRKRARNSLAYEPPLPGTCFRISTWTRTGVAVWSNW